MKALSQNLWLLTYPLRLLGVDMRRHVTVVRLDSGDLVIHSTGPFAPQDVKAIHTKGRPAWIVEAMLSHDTFSREGWSAFPEVPFLAPAGFSERVAFPVQPILPPPPEWSGQLEVLRVEGNEIYGEHVFFHPASRTLIVADLAFNFSDDEPFWTELLLKVAVGSEHCPGMARPFRHAITDESAFCDSMRAMMAWDFDRVIVGHGDIIETGGHAAIQRMLEHAGF